MAVLTFANWFCLQSMQCIAAITVRQRQGAPYLECNSNIFWHLIHQSGRHLGAALCCLHACLWSAVREGWHLSVDVALLLCTPQHAHRDKLPAMQDLLSNAMYRLYPVPR